MQKSTSSTYLINVTLMESHEGLDKYSEVLNELSCRPLSRIITVMGHTLCARHISLPFLCEVQSASAWQYCAVSSYCYEE